MYSIVYKMKGTDTVRPQAEEVPGFVIRYFLTRPNPGQK
jgi:hypothetical protein